MRSKYAAFCLVFIMALSLASIAFAQGTGGGTTGGTGGNTGGGGTGGNTGSSTGGNTGGNAGGGIQLPNPLRCDDVECVRNSILKAVQTIGWYLVSIMILWGGIQILTAAGNPEKLAQGKRTILYAVIGFVILLLAASVTFVIQSLLNTAAG